jgi:hypothetical protein
MRCSIPSWGRAVALRQRTRMMPLTRAHDRYTVGADGIRFLMRDGPSELICQIAARTLVELGKTASMDEPVEIFAFFRTKIERAASNKYDRTARGDYEVVTVSTTDLDLAAD